MDTPDLRTALSRELTGFVRAAGARRVIAATFHLGRPGGPAHERVALPDDPRYDGGLRADLVERGLERFAADPSPRPWLTRSGELAVTDVDVAWAAAARAGFARHGLAFPGFHVVTRAGWLDLGTGEITRERVRRARRQRR